MASGQGGLDDLQTTARRAADGSRVVRAGRTLASWVRGSWLYRWLTKEPDPEVIVIDLRETYTVGPFVRALDWAIDRAAPAWRSSGIKRTLDLLVARLRERPLRLVGISVALVATASFLAEATVGDPPTARIAAYLAVTVLGLLGTASDRSWADIRETRAVELLIAAFEPPEPPERVDGPRTPEGSDGSQDDDSADSAPDAPESDDE